MSKPNKNKSLAVLGAETTGVVDALQILKDELKGLDAIAETPYQTGNAKVEGFSRSVQEETDIATLVKMHSSIFGRANAYNASQDALANKVGGTFTAPVFKINGYTPEEYEKDIVLKIRVTQIENRRKELTDLVNEAKTFLGEKEKWSLFQQKMAAVASGKPASETAYAQIMEG